VKKGQKKNAAAVELANLRARKLSAQRRKEISNMGASAGGRARAQKLSGKRRSEIARKAAETRWGKKQK
jgi:hypothetical protein